MNLLSEEGDPRAAIARSTPFPNYLLDTVMPTLKDTEWRVLCVVVRQTLGCRSIDDKRRKTSDWLTQSQLKRRTGRESGAVSKAMESLVRKGLLSVRNRDGKLLHTPQARRLCGSGLYFELGEKAKPWLEIDGGKAIRKANFEMRIQQE